MWRGAREAMRLHPLAFEYKMRINDLLDTRIVNPINGMMGRQPLARNRSKKDRPNVSWIAYLVRQLNPAMPHWHRATNLTVYSEEHVLRHLPKDLAPHEPG